MSGGGYILGDGGRLWLVVGLFWVVLNGSGFILDDFRWWWVFLDGSGYFCVLVCVGGIFLGDDGWWWVFFG